MSALGRAEYAEKRFVLMLLFCSFKRAGSSLLDDLSLCQREIWEENALAHDETNSWIGLQLHDHLENLTIDGMPIQVPCEQCRDGRCAKGRSQWQALT